MKTSRIFALTCGAALLTSLPLFAQPNPDNVPKAENPANRAPGALRGERNALTPEQLRERMREAQRRQLERAGLTDRAAQDAVLAYMEGERAAREELSQKTRALGQGARGNTLSDTQLLTLLNEYHAAVEEDRARREKALAELKKTINFAQHPRMELMLILSGAYGDGPLAGGMGRMPLLMDGMMGGRGRERANEQVNAPRGRERGAERGNTRPRAADDAPAMF